MILASTAHSIDPLIYTISDAPIIDVLRVITALAGMLLFIVSTVRWLQHERFWTGMAFMAFGMLTALQEIQQMGQPFLVWRCPILLIGCLCGVRYMYYTIEQIKDGPSR